MISTKCTIEGRPPPPLNKILNVALMGAPMKVLNWKITLYIVLFKFYFSLSLRLRADLGAPVYQSIFLYHIVIITVNKPIKKPIEEKKIYLARFGWTAPWLLEYQPVFQLPMNKTQSSSFRRQFASRIHCLNNLRQQLTKLDCATN